MMVNGEEWPDLALSVHPQAAMDILRKKKRAEYRNRPTSVRGRVWLYAARPLQLLLGTVEITGCKPPKEKGQPWSWTLRNPEWTLFAKPVNHPLPVFWKPFPPNVDPLDHEVEDDYFTEERCAF